MISSEYQSLEDIEGSYVESGLNEPHEFGLEIGEMRHDLQKGCFIIYDNYNYSYLYYVRTEMFVE